MQGAIREVVPDKRPPGYSDPTALERYKAQSTQLAKANQAKFLDGKTGATEDDAIQIMLVIDSPIFIPEDGSWHPNVISFAGMWPGPWAGEDGGCKIFASDALHLNDIIPLEIFRSAVQVTGSEGMVIGCIGCMTNYDSLCRLSSNSSRAGLVAALPYARLSARMGRRTRSSPPSVAPPTTGL